VIAPVAAMFDALQSAIDSLKSDVGDAENAISALETLTSAITKDGSDQYTIDPGANDRAALSVRNATGSPGANVLVFQVTSAGVGKIEVRDATGAAKITLEGANGGEVSIGSKLVLDQNAVVAELLDDETVSNEASYSVTWDNAKDYYKIEVIISGLRPAADDTPLLRTTSDGQNFDSGASDYSWNLLIRNTGGNGGGQDNFDPAITLFSTSIEGTNGHSGSLELTILDPGNTAAAP